MKTLCTQSYDNSANGINFTIRNVNLMFVFIVVVWIFFFNKYMIQNPVFFVYNVIMLSIVYAIDLFTVPSAILEMQPPTRENEAGVDSR